MTSNFIQSIFSVKNSKNKTHKVLTILGIKFCFRRYNIKPHIDTFIENFKSIISILLFCVHKIDKKSILIVELNPYHAETLPGYVKYFKELGYKTDLFLRNKNVEDNPFIDTKDINIFTCSPFCFKFLLKKRKIEKYDFLFISTAYFWHDDKFFLDFIGCIPKTKHGVLMVEHDIKNTPIKEMEAPYLKEGRLFTLSGFKNTIMLNPHFFVNLKPEYNKNKKTKFVIAGRWIKASKYLFDAIDRLYNENITDFEIEIIGLKFDIPKKYAKNIKSLGFLSFKNMYKAILNSDFILPLLDPFDSAHDYIGGTTSGSRQLSLGFLKPLVISSEYAQSYNLNTENTVLYPNNDLYEAMKRCIEMNNKDYQKMRNATKELANQVHQKSLENLNCQIKKFSKSC